MKNFPWLKTLPYLAFLAVGFLLFPATGRDDKYISFWPAYTLAEYGEMINYNGQRVEQSSSLLLVLILAALRGLSGLTLPVLGYATSIACGVLTLSLTGRSAARLSPGNPLWAMGLTATSTYFVYWAFGGMETPLVGLCAVGFVHTLGVLLTSSARDTGALGRFVLATAAYLLVRPESPMVVGCVLAFVTALTALQRFTVPTKTSAPTTPSAALLLKLWGIAAALTGALVAFRLGYFGSPFPQPVAAKAGHAGLGAWVWSTKLGLGYLGRNPLVFPLAAAALLGATRFALDARTRVDFMRASLVGFLLAYGAYLIMSGGGWMEGARMVAHVAPLVALLASDGLIRVLREGPRVAALASVLLALQLLGSVHFAVTESISLPLWETMKVRDLGSRHFAFFERGNREQRRDAAVVEALDGLLAKLPKASLSERPAVLSHNMGMIMFYLERDHPERLATIDLHGLTDRYVTDSAYRDELESWALGLRWNHVSFFRDYDRFARETGAPQPTFMFWNNNTARGGDEWTRELGFRTYLAQRGRVSPDPEQFFHGIEFTANQFWSVREDAAKRLGLPDDALYVDMPTAEREGLGNALGRRKPPL